MAVNVAPPSRPVDFWSFLRAPDPHLPRPGRAWFRTFAGLWGLALLVPFLSLPAVVLATNSTDAQNTLDEIPVGLALVLGIFVAPVLEELAFRLPLAQLRSSYLVISGLAFALVLFPFGLIGLLAAIAAASVPALRARLARVSFRTVFYTSAVLFGLIHLFNYRFETIGLGLVAAPLLVAPQTMLGVVFGYARVRLGMWGAILLHSAYNTPLLLGFALLA